VKTRPSPPLPPRRVISRHSPEHMRKRLELREASTRVSPLLSRCTIEHCNSAGPPLSQCRVCRVQPIRQSPALQAWREDRGGRREEDGDLFEQGSHTSAFKRTSSFTDAHDLGTPACLRYELVASAARLCLRKCVAHGNEVAGRGGKIKGKIRYQPRIHPISTNYGLLKPRQNRHLRR